MTTFFSSFLAWGVLGVLLWLDWAGRGWAPLPLAVVDSTFFLMALRLSPLWPYS
jgi:hypothetical protein